MPRNATKTGAMIGWLILALTLVVSPVLGSASSVLALLLSFALLPALAEKGAMREVVQAPAQLIFIAVFAALTLLYGVTARAPADVLFSANFLAMPLSASVYLVASRRRGSDAALLIVRLCLAGALVALAFAMFDVFVRGLPRAAGLIGNPNLMPRLTLPLGFVALAGVFLDKGAARWIYPLGAAAATLTTLLCGSRGAAIAIPALALIAALFLWRARETRRVVMIAAGLAAAGAAAWLLMSGPATLERFAGIDELIADVLRSGQASADSATQERLNMYAAGLQAFQQSPWIGWGWAHLGTAAAAVNPAQFAHEAGTAFMFHNDAINFAVAGGIVGLIGLAALLAAPLAGALASGRDGMFALRFYCCAVLSVGHAIFGLTDSTLGYDAPTTLYAFLTAIVLGAFRETPAVPPP